MKEDILALLRCPNCGGALGFECEARQNHELLAGCFSCTVCPSTFGMKDGVPVFVPSDLSPGVRQVQSSYNARWNRMPHIYDEESFGTKHQHEWYLARYHWDSEQALGRFLQRKSTILDAGCGLGKDLTWYAGLSPSSTVIGVDLSEGVFYAYERSKHYSNISTIQADLNKLPFAAETFDLIVCDQVLTAVEDPRVSVERLWSLVAPGGHFAFNLYKKKCPIREFCDDFLRDKIGRMTLHEAWEASSNITRLGKALAELRVEVEVPTDIPELGIKAGRYDLQRFIYYNVLKCFWNDAMTFDENNLVNVDWYHTAYAHRYSVEEIEQWTRDLRMKILVLDTNDLSNISVLAEKVQDE